MNSGVVNKLLTANMKHLPPDDASSFPICIFIYLFFFALATSAVFPNKFMPIYLHFMQKKKKI